MSQCFYLCRSDGQDFIILSSFEIAKNFEDGLRTNNISRPAKQPGLYTSIRSIQFLTSIPGGSRQCRCLRTNLGIETRWIGPDVHHLWWDVRF